MESGAVKYALPDASVPHDKVPADPGYSIFPLSVTLSSRIFLAVIVESRGVLLSRQL